MTRQDQYRVLEIGSVLRGVGAEDLQALLNGAAAEGWELQQVVPRESSNKFLAVFRRRDDRHKREISKTAENWIGDWGIN